MTRLKKTGFYFMQFIVQVTATNDPTLINRLSAIFIRRLIRIHFFQNICMKQDEQQFLIIAEGSLDAAVKIIPQIQKQVDVYTVQLFTAYKNKPHYEQPDI